MSNVLKSLVEGNVDPAVRVLKNNSIHIPDEDQTFSEANVSLIDFKRRIYKSCTLECSKIGTVFCLIKKVS